jgi:protein SCO1
MKSSLVPLSLLCSLLFLVTDRDAFSEDSVTTHPVQGVVEKIAPDHHQATIHHQAIPGYMMEMTMDFPVKNPGELADITVGDKISFTLNVGKETEWIDHIQLVGHSEKPLSSTMATPNEHLSKLKPGDTLPDGDFVAENGRTMHFSDFRGKVVAFTFFFTRCPLPDFCPLMNRNLENARDILLSSSIDPSKWQLLSLSFDAAYDQPEVLVSYAKSYRGDRPDHWIFGTASPKTLAQVAAPLGLVVMNQGKSIAHNLRTVVINPNGRVFCQFNDNDWTASQLAEAIQQAAKIPLK